MVTGDLHNFAQAENIHVYPNPAKGILTIKINDFDNSELTTISIFHLTGQIINQIPARGGEVNIDIGTYSHGMYLVKATQLNKVYRATFIKE